MNDTIYSINGPVVTLRGARGFSMMEMVYVGEVGLIGEVIGITSEKTTIQVYEDTAGLKVGEPVRGTGAPLCATLGPGIMQNIFDARWPLLHRSTAPLSPAVCMWPAWTSTGFGT